MWSWELSPVQSRNYSARGDSDQPGEQWAYPEYVGVNPYLQIQMSHLPTPDVLSQTEPEASVKGKHFQPQLPVAQGDHVRPVAPALSPFWAVLMVLLRPSGEEGVF